MERNLIIVLIVVIVVIGVVVFLLAGSSTTQAVSNEYVTSQVSTRVSSTSNSETYSVDIRGFAFNSVSLSIKVGDSVTWTNKDSAFHTVTSESGSELNSNSLGNGEAYSHTFTVSGTYTYHCKFHPGMKGTIIVS